MSARNIFVRIVENLIYVKFSIKLAHRLANYDALYQNSVKKLLPTSNVWMQSELTMNKSDEKLRWLLEI